MIRFFILTLFVGLSSGVYAKDLAKVIELLAKNNESIQLAKQNFQSQVIDARKAGIFIKPQVDAKLDFYRTESESGDVYKERSKKLTISQEIFHPWHPDWQKSSKKAKLQVQKAVWDFYLALSNQILIVVDSYLKTLDMQQSLQVQKRTLDVAKKAYDKTDLQFQSGTKTRYERLQAEVFYFSAQSDFDELKNLFEQNLTTLNQLVHTEFESLVEITKLPKSTTPNTLDKQLEYTGENNWDLKSAYLAIEIAKAELKAQKYNSYPKASFNYSYNDQSGLSPNHQYGVSINIPIYKGGLKNYQVDSAHSALLSKTLAFDSLVIDIKSQLRQLLNEQKNLKKRQISAQKTLQSAEFLDETAQILFAQGTKSIQAVADSQRDLAKALLDLKTIDHQIIFNHLKIARIRGDFSTDYLVGFLAEIGFSIDRSALNLFTN